MMNKCLQIALFIWDKEVLGQNANAESFQLWENTSTLGLLNMPILVKPCWIFKKRWNLQISAKMIRLLPCFTEKYYLKIL